MALIKCPECEREISDKAKVCVHCGCPIVLDSQDNVFIKAALHPSNPSFNTITRIGIYDSNNKCISEVRPGNISSFRISQPTSIYAKFLQNGKNTESNMIRLDPCVVNRLQAGYNIGWINIRLTLNKVDFVDAD